MDDVTLQHAWDLYQLDNRAALSRLFWSNALVAGRQYERYGRDERAATLAVVQMLYHRVTPIANYTLQRVEHALQSGMDRMERWLPNLVWNVPENLGREAFEQVYKAEFMGIFADTRDEVDVANSLVGWATLHPDGSISTRNDNPFLAGREGEGALHRPKREIEVMRERRNVLKRRGRSDVVVGEVVPVHRWTHAKQIAEEARNNVDVMDTSDDGMPK